MSSTYMIPSNLETRPLVAKNVFDRRLEVLFMNIMATLPVQLIQVVKHLLNMKHGRRWQRCLAIGSFVIMVPMLFYEKKLNRVIGIAGLDYPSDWPGAGNSMGTGKTILGEKVMPSEAVRAIKEMAIQYVPQISLISLIHPDNINSSNLAKAVGAKFEKEIFFRNGNWHIYRHE